MQNIPDNEFIPVETRELLIGGVHIGPGMPHLPKYPRWLYREDETPLQVENTEEEQAARRKGYDSVTPGSIACGHLVNWVWDFEDMSAKQLSVYAREVLDIDLPEYLGQDRLFKAVLSLVRNDPRNKDRLVFMAHTIEMEYDATQDEIRRMINNGNATTEEHFEEQFEA